MATENGVLQKQTNNCNSKAITKINTDPSTFIPYEEILTVDINKDETIAELFADLYAQDGEVENIYQIMSFHTKYLKDFLHFHNYLMYSQGVLSSDLRHYLAILASSRHKCLYLVKQQEKEFKQRSVNSDWLKGIDYIPQKLKDLYEINKILAHQPWLINHEHIAKALRGQFSWSITELIMAITILIHFHALSGFVFGCGINDKYMQLVQQMKDLSCGSELIDSNNNHTASATAQQTVNGSTSTKAIDIIHTNHHHHHHNGSGNSYTNNHYHNYFHASHSPVLSEINFLLREMQTIKHEEIRKKEETKENNPLLNRSYNNNNSNKYSSSSTSSSISSSSSTAAATQQQQQQNANNTPSCINTNILPNSGVNTNTNTTSATSKTFESHSKNSNSSSSSTIVEDVNNYILKYTYDPDYTHPDFDNADQTLKLEYYTWEHHGYITGCSLYPEISNLLDQTFKTAYNMTYNTMGAFKSVDTSLFRRAVWIYIHKIFGITYDDYEYTQLNKLLAHPLRSFIKTVCMSPERITKKDYDSIMKEFSHSEKVHINIVIMEARMQASMLYFFRAITQYYYNDNNYNIIF